MKYLLLFIGCFAACGGDTLESLDLHPAPFVFEDHTKENGDGTKSAVESCLVAHACGHSCEFINGKWIHPPCKEWDAAERKARLDAASDDAAKKADESAQYSCPFCGETYSLGTSHWCEKYLPITAPIKYPSGKTERTPDNLDLMAATIYASHFAHFNGNKEECMREAYADAKRMLEIRWRTALVDAEKHF